jgi:hypothetical protein
MPRSLGNLEPYSLERYDSDFYQFISARGLVVRQRSHSYHEVSLEPGNARLNFGLKNWIFGNRVRPENRTDQVFAGFFFLREFVL